MFKWVAGILVFMALASGLFTQHVHASVDPVGALVLVAAVVVLYNLCFRAPSRDAEEFGSRVGAMALLIFPGAALAVFIVVSIIL